MSSSRKPAAFVEINGQTAYGVLECTVDSNSYAQADTFSVTFSVDRLLQDDWTKALSGSVNNIDLFLSADQLIVSIYFSDDYPTNPAQRFMLGRTDDVSYDPIRQTVTFSGRDYTGYLIDTKTTNKYPNLTIAQVVQQLAAKHGMTAVVGTNSSKKVGAYLNNYQAQMGDGKSEWDLLRFLAENTVDPSGNSYVVYVSGSVLYFQPRPQVADYQLQYQAPTQDSASPVFGGTIMDFSRNLTVAKNIIVQINVSGIGVKAFSVSYPKAVRTITAGSATSSQQVIIRERTGLTKEAALRAAQALQQDMSRHEVKMTATMPADIVLTPANMIQVSGTNTLFDQGYYADSVRRTISIQNGFVMSISAKNSAQESGASI